MNRLERLWWCEQEPWSLQALLSPLLMAEALFSAGVAIRSFLYGRGWAPRERPPVPVVSVGNLTVGGAGKTPATLAIGAKLLARGRRLAVLSRGYGATRSDPRLVSDGRAIKLGAAEGGDEPVLLARRLPGAVVLCGPRRVELAERAVAEHGADVLLLDDGFQHRALARDLDLVVVDASNPRGNGHLLPRGPNREPSAALARAGLVWLSHVDAAGLQQLEDLRAAARAATGHPPVESRYAATDVLGAGLDRSFGKGALRGRRVLLLSALARPQGFRRTIESLGAVVAGEQVFRDHHRFTMGEVEEALQAAAAAGCDGLVTTEKDAVRLPEAAAQDERIQVVRIEAEILAGAEAIEAALARALGAGAGPAARSALP